MAQGAGEGFIHLRVRSAYSLLEGAIKAEKIGELAAADEMPAVALTDRANLFGALEFSVTAKDAGVQPIIGCALPVSGIGDRIPERWARTPTVVLLAQNEQGWLNLSRLSSAAYLDPQNEGEPCVPWRTVAEHAEGLLLLSGGPDGPVDPLYAAGKTADGDAALAAMHSVFGDRLYVELQRHETAAEAHAEPGLVAWAYDNDVPLVATNDVYFAKPTLYEAHDALLCISDGAFLGQDDRRRVTGEHWFKPAKTMRELFSDLPEACDNTLDIARRCAFMVRKRDPILPSFSTGAGRSEAEEMAHQAREGLRARLAANPLSAPEEEYWARLEREVGVIGSMGFSGYFLIVSDFIKHAKAKGVPVGPGRGSGAGSLVAWALTITDLDTLRFGLLFERFLNPERVSMPDFDIDFCQERREEVISYVQDKYGDDRVAQIITFGTLQARAVLRDVGRVMQLPLGMVDRLAKMVPNNPAAPVTLAKAIEIEPRLQQAKRDEASVADLLEVALKLEGLYRNASTHAAGVVIGDRPLVELGAAVQGSAVGAAGHPVQHEVGGVRGPGEVRLPRPQDPDRARPGGEAPRQARGRRRPVGAAVRRQALLRADGVGPDRRRVPARRAGDARHPAEDAAGLDRGDHRTHLTLSARADGQHRHLRRLQVRSAPGRHPAPLARTGAAGDLRGDRLPGTGDADRPDPGRLLPRRSRPSAPGYGQEEEGGDGPAEGQVRLRRHGARGSRRPGRFHLRAGGQVRRLRVQQEPRRRLCPDRLPDGLAEGEPPGRVLRRLHEPRHLQHDKLAVFYQDAKAAGVKVRAPDVNRSAADFEVENGEVLYALGAVRNVGLEAMKHLVAVRREGGPFTDLFDFVERVDPRLVNKRALENLARAGAFDSIHPNRAQILASADILIAHGQAAAGDRASAQVSLFGDQSEAARPRLPRTDPWALPDQLDEELSAVGYYLSGHPLEDMVGALRRRRTTLYVDAVTQAEQGHEAFKMAGIVRRRQERSSARSGEKFAFVSLSDPTGEYEVLFPPEQLRRCRDVLEPGKAISLKVRAKSDGGEVRFFGDDAEPIERAIEHASAGLRIHLSPRSAEIEAIKKRLEIASNARGGEVALIAAIDGGQEIELRLPGRFSLDAAMRGALKTAPGVLFLEDV